ncbi:probable signal peptidase complex subunit 1 [Asparagus officinalis]|uniref:probable signal peptidase complex subunit 1 n=1 Tax=Asparagus officinalis TaxID=4686 RepID=UPI00098E485D|nr:probable signal peptidase complex subunit 1 [Asparagus officinalis]XP_020246954.1 probable signal peptidase complex subunit 1 [Asparagus officinalis]XP_020246955.1 probable signal peptidase complex subunit 1 [Asparagus officinalis]XP_020246956.1 probable signal peptidase complex subunit 1 [Asparagus officinalis]
MDWQGQKLSEKTMEIMLIAFAAMAFAVGYAVGSFQMMLFIYAGGIILTALVTLPSWPFFNRHPLVWLDPSEAERNPKPQVVPSKKHGAKQRQK